MNIEQAQDAVGKQVWSYDAGDKMIERVSVCHGPYKLIRVTKGGMCELSSGRFVKPTLLKLTNDQIQELRD